MAQTAASVKDAINIAAKAAGRDDLIVVTGSFYVAGEAKRLLDEKKSRDGHIRVGSSAPSRT
jgi:folylpolyglutamate synthase/dihydropteroate synthase